MSGLQGHVEEYLRLRRAVGFKLKEDERLLGQLVTHVKAAGATTVTSELAISWARLPVGVHPNRWAKRLRIARGFAAYLQRSTRRRRSRRRACFRFAVSAAARTCSPSRTSAGCWRKRGGCATRCARRATRRCSGCWPCPACVSAEVVALERSDVDLD